MAREPERRKETVHVVPVFSHGCARAKRPRQNYAPLVAFPSKKIRVRVHGEQVYPWGSPQKDSVAELPLDRLVGDCKPVTET